MQRNTPECMAAKTNRTSSTLSAVHDRRVIRGNASKPESKPRIRSIPFCFITDRCTASQGDRRITNQWELQRTFRYVYLRSAVPCSDLPKGLAPLLRADGSHRV